MLKSLIFFTRFLLLWMLFFFLERVIFLSVFYSSISGRTTLTECIAAFYHGLRLDLAMTGYVSAVPLLYLLACYLAGKHHIQLRWIKIYNTVLVVVFGIIAVADLNIYREWGSKINAKALEFAFRTPNEALASSASSPILQNLLFLAILIASGIFLNKVLIQDKISPQKSPFWIKIIYGTLLLGVNFLMVRGGIGVSTNNLSMAYYSEVLTLNHAAVNTEWNLVYSLIKSNSKHKNEYQFFPQDQVSREMQALYPIKADSTVKMLNTDRPNIVLIIMESFTADLTETLGQEKGITPNFDEMIKSGILFSKIYSAGNRTDKGVIGTLAGFPTMAAENVVKYTDKMEKIPALPQAFKKLGYHTSFFYGGQSEFDNYKAFMLSHDIEMVVDKSNFDAKDMNSKWGAYDGVVFNRQLQELNKASKPFFSVQLTLTNHEPFELPGAYKFGNADNLQKFKSTAFYTDSCLNAFIESAKKQDWYKNTLFIMLADHGHIQPKGREEIYIPERYHIPMLFFGDVIKKEYQGKIIDKVGSQIDLASTLLHQLGLDAKPYTWSKNLLDPQTKPFAFFSWDNGMGFIDNQQCVTFDNVGQRILYNTHPELKERTTELLNNSKSFLQQVYESFLAL